MEAAPGRKPDKNIFTISRNGEREIIQVIKITSRYSRRIKRRKQMSQFSDLPMQYLQFCIKGKLLPENWWEPKIGSTIGT